MGSDLAIGGLAFITIGGTLALGVFHFGYQLRSAENREAARRVASDRESATTRLSAEGAGGRSLRQRLDDAPGIDDPLSARYAGAGLLDAIYDAKWSDVRSVLRIER